MSLFKYFKVSSSSPLPSPSGPLSAEIPSTAINAANEEVLKALKASEDESGVKRRGSYKKYTAKEKATVGNYALMHGTSAALRNFKSQYPDLKYTTVCDWKKAIAAKA